jgi:hypothetical protein
MSERTEQHELRELLERDRIVALVDDYVTTLDEGRPLDEEWARSLFTEDVRLEHEIAVLHGVEEVAAAHRLLMGRWERTFHYSANHRVTFDGEHAHLSARLMAIHVHPGAQPPDPLIAANLLDADAVLTTNGWRFERFAPLTIWRCGQSAADVSARES